MTITVKLLAQKKLITSVLLTLIIALLGFYIFQVSSLTTLAYHIAAQEQKLTTLQEKHQSLEMTYMQTPSFGNFEELAQRLNFEKNTAITYIKVKRTAVAQQ